MAFQFLCFVSLSLYPELHLPIVELEKIGFGNINTGSILLLLVLLTIIKQLKPKKVFITVAYHFYKVYR